MLWALLAKLLLRQPPLVQAVALGLSTGLFATAAAEANNRDPKVSSTVWLALVWGGASAALYYAGFVVQRRRGPAGDGSASGWVYALYAAVWILGLVAALLALLGDGGLKVAALAIVPLVLLAPSALHGLRLVVHRAPA